MAMLQGGADKAQKRCEEDAQHGISIRAVLRVVKALSARGHLTTSVRFHQTHWQIAPLGRIHGARVVTHKCGLTLRHARMPAKDRTLVKSDSATRVAA